MYREQAWTVGDTDVARLRVLSASLDLAPGPGGARITDATGPLLERFGDAIGPVRWRRIAVVALYPSQQIVGHADAPIVGTRYHLPIVVNPGCWVFHAGTWQQLQVGRVYQMNPTEEHGAVNWGDAVRLHVMVDGE